MASELYFHFIHIKNFPSKRHNIVFDSNLETKNAFRTLTNTSDEWRHLIHIVHLAKDEACMGEITNAHRTLA
jgi:hypothetical protein